MNVDSIFLKGSTHLVCEDYSLAGGLAGGEGKYAIVADGCSSGYRSDVAARILAHLAEYLVRTESRKIMRTSPIEVTERFIHLLSFSYFSLQHIIPPNNLLSTLVVAIVREGEARVMTFGDGFLFYHSESGWYRQSVSFSQEAPRYPAYMLDKRLKDQYEKEFKDQVVIDSFGPPDLHRVTRSILDPSTWYGSVIDLSMEAVDTIVISSDGAGSFTEPDENDEAHPGHAIDELLAFKTYHGEFLKRRVLRATETLAKRGIVHTDDLGLAVITRKS